MLTENRNMTNSDPVFANRGGTDPSDYVPANVDAIKDKGVRIENLPGDDIGLVIGFEVESDYFGNTISGLPDIGAVELP